jgi:hypothetical protein
MFPAHGLPEHAPPDIALKDNEPKDNGPGDGLRRRQLSAFDGVNFQNFSHSGQNEETAHACPV